MSQRAGKESPIGGAARREPLAVQVIEETAQRLWVIADANRIALLEALKDGEATVQALADRVGLPHQNVSHHLAVLRRAGIVSRRREGAASHFLLADWSACWVIEQLAGLVQAGPDE